MDCVKLILKLLYLYQYNTPHRCALNCEVTVLIDDTIFKSYQLQKHAIRQRF